MTNSMAREGSTWGASARDWAEVQEPTLKPLFEVVLERTGIGPGSAVLDVACGTGLFCVLAAARGATVAGLDASPGQLAVARERLPAGDFREGDMGALPFATATFDLVTCCNALQYAADPVQTLREMRRVARPGAPVGILTSSRAGGQGGFSFFSALRAFLPPPPPDAPPKTIFSDPDALDRFLGEAGLTIDTDEDLQCDWEYPDLDTALRGVLSFAPGVRAIRAAGAEPVRAAVGAAISPYRRADGSYRLPCRMRYVLARGT